MMPHIPTELLEKWHDKEVIGIYLEKAVQVIILCMHKSGRVEPLTYSRKDES